MGKVKVAGGVLLLAAAVSAPQAHWWLLSGERTTLTAAQVEAAVTQEYEIANELRLDRLECEPVRTPGTSVCDAQEDDEIFGLLYEVKGDGKTELSKVEPS